jgi:hypothetical protein
VAEDLKLAVVIQALLDAKGFDQAQIGLKNLADTANKTTNQQKKLGESFGGTRGPVADLTRVLLMNTGVTGAAGEAAKAAGTAMYFFEGAATATNVAIAGGVAAIALLLPKLIDWLSTTTDLKDAHEGLKTSLIQNLEQIDKYATNLQTASDAATLLAGALRTQAIEKEREKITEMRREIAIYTENMKKLGQTIIDSAAIRGLQAQIVLMEEAHRQGISFAESLEQVGKQEHKFALDLTGVNSALQRDAEDRARAVMFAAQQELDGIGAISGAQEKAYKVRIKELEEETKRLLALVGLKITDTNITIANETKKRQQYAQTVGSLGQIASALSDLFGRNKALAIAGAILDTYAGAASALADKTVPTYVRFAAAAAVIAQGLAYVAQIRKTNPVGFDDPFSDLVARRLGRQSADDFVHHFGGEFMRGLTNFGQAAQNVSNTTINRGTTVDMSGMTVNGVLGHRTQFRKFLEREMERATRVRRRRTVGR